jgi:hypothetical protein
MAEASTQQLADVLIAFLPSRRGIDYRNGVLPGDRSADGTSRIGQVGAFRYGS